MKLNGVADYHVHTAVSVDCQESVEACCIRAVELGLDEIGFSNHVMLKFPGYFMTEDDLLDHYQQIKICQKQFPHLIIRLAMELDYYSGMEDQIAALVKRYESLIGRKFDFIIGSVHYMKGVFFSSSRSAPDLFAQASVAEIYCDYFQLLSKAVHTGIFDVIAHPDLIKKYTHQLHPPLDFDIYRASAERFITALLENGVAMEVNTKGLRISAKEIYPSRELLSLYVERALAEGVLPMITLGSDAHRAENIGMDFDRALQLIHQAGASSLTRFERRVAIATPLPEIDVVGSSI